MRSINDVRGLWLAFKKHKSLDELRADVRIIEHGDPAGIQLRSAYWKALLVFDSVDSIAWQSALISSRSAYEALRSRFSSSLTSFDHLAETSSQQDHVLLAEIQQDVERCMPGISFFQDITTQKMLLDILFVFCKLNPDLSYRQGMHELLAPILWVVEHDAIDVGQSSKLMDGDALISAVFSSEYIEHDAFAIFSQVMQNAKKFYEQTTHTALENPLISRSERITSTYLSQIDPELATHLDNSGIVPQIFLIRWIRLLFGREFEFGDVLTVWDIIFAEDPSLEIVDHICLTMLLRIRWELLDSTYNEALSLLLHYPPLDQETTAQSMTIDALALQSNMAVVTANRLVVRYTGRAMLAFNKPATPPAFQRNITSISGMDAFRKTLRGKASEGSGQINFEALLQSTAQNILNRGEQLGIGSAVRTAINDVQRKAQEIRETHAASSPSSTWRQRPRSAQTLSAKLRAFEERNSQLASLLDSAVSQLWDVQKVLAENAEASSSTLDIEKFSVAIGQVQYVQVYLQDSTLPLAQTIEPANPFTQEDKTEHALNDEKEGIDSTTEEKPADASQQAVSDEPTSQKTSMSTTFHTPSGQRTIENSAIKQGSIDSHSPSTHSTLVPRDNQSSIEGLLDPSAFDEALDRDTDYHNTDTTTDKPVASEAATHDSPKSMKRLSISHRPPLSESAYSWMLGHNSDDTFGTSKETAPKLDRPETLFSDSKDGELLVTHKTRKGIRPKKKYATPAVSTDVNLNFEA